MKAKKKPGLGGILLRILGGILALVLLFLLVMWGIPMTETADRTAVPDSADWMGKLPDEMPLNAIVIPGTHDRGTQYVQLAFFSKCQALDIGSQLEAGFRYLDIRLSVDGEGMRLKHGFTDCKTGPMPWSAALSLEDVLRQCYTFLAEHPTETVIFAVKQEHGDESVEQFERCLDGIIGQEPEFWLFTDSIPTLGQARGKLVLLRRYEDAAGLGERSGIPLLWPNQNGYEDPTLNTAMTDQGAYRLWVQDRYEYDAGEKWEAFRAGLREDQIGSGDLAIHFLSTKGHAAYGHPFAFAGKLNPELMDYELLPGSGWVIVDFASALLAEHIYAANFA